MPTPACTITGTLQDLTGTANVGSVQFKLGRFGSNIPRVAGTGILVQINNTATANNSGAFTATLWGNDQITPSGTCYNVTYLTSAGTPIMTVGYQFTGTGGDLSSLSPLATTPGQALENPVLTNPSGVQVISGFALQLPQAILTSAAPTVASGQVGLGSTTATSATAGTNGAVPAQVAGYLIINVAGTVQKIPFFNS